MYGRSRKHTYHHLELEYLNKRASECNYDLIPRDAMDDLIKELNDSKIKRSRRKRVPLTNAQRNHILKRDNYRCVKCGAEDDLCIHHIVPVSKRGSNGDHNLITLCRLCHSKEHPKVSQLILSRSSKKQE